MKQILKIKTIIKSLKLHAMCDKLKATNSITLLRKKQTGFTLIELLVYIGLLSIMVFVLTEIFVSIIDTQLSAKNTSSVASDGRYIYSRFLYDVDRATSVTVPANYGDTSQSMTLVINGQNYTYQLDGDGNLTLTDPTSTEVLNGEGSEITSISFTKLGDPSYLPTVQLKFTIENKFKRAGVNSSEDFQTTAAIREK